MVHSQTQQGVIHVRGDLDLAAATSFARTVQDSLERCDGSALIVDLKDCTFIDSTAIGILVELRAAANERGITLRLRRTPAPVVRVLALLGLTEAFGITRQSRAVQRAELRDRAARARTEQRERTAELHARTSAAFDTIAQMARELDEARTKIENLQVALQTNRRIGQALGIIMERLKVTEDDAFAVLRSASQHQHCKLRELAEHVVRTGEIPSAA
jgi:anti-anti-sigma factor